jgi:hypothetical protein
MVRGLVRGLVEVLLKAFRVALRPRKDRQGREARVEEGPREAQWALRMRVPHRRQMKRFLFRSRVR